MESDNKCVFVIEPRAEVPSLLKCEEPPRKYKKIADSPCVQNYGF